MAHLQAELFIWSSQKQTINDTPTGVHQYHEKDAAAVQPYAAERQLYDESRDIVWVLKNKRPEKLRDTLKEFEDLSLNHRCIHYRWRARRLFQILLSNGALTSFVLSAHSGDLEKIFIDKTLVGKLSSDKVADAVVTDSYIVLSHHDTSKLDYVYFGKKLPSGDAIKKMDRLSTYDVKYSQIEIPGPQTNRRLDRKLLSSVNDDLIVCWWPVASQEAWPWSPMSSDKERCNLVLLSISGTKVEIVSFIRTDNDPISVQFSQTSPNVIHMVERISGSSNQHTVEISSYEVSRNRIQKTSAAVIPLRAPVTTCCRNPAEDRVIIATENGTLILYDEDKKVTQTEQISVPPNHIAWHPDGALILISSNRGDIQLVDLALNVIPLRVLGEKSQASKTLRLTQFFRTPPVLSHATWCPCEVVPSDYMTDSTDSLFLIFDKGPVAVFQLPLGVHSPNLLTTAQLVNDYIRHRQLDEAVSLLCSLNWNTEPQICYHALMAIMVHLLRLPLNVVHEAQLESTLGSFYSPHRPLSEAVVLEYRDSISRLARRFFHHLLRHSRFDKAYLLAVDIGQVDLFTDLYHLAKDKGETALAEVARRKVDQLHDQNSGSSESLSSLETDSHDSAESPRRGDYFETDLDSDYSRQGLRSVQV